MAQDALKKSLDVPGRLQHASRRFRPSMLASSGLNLKEFLIFFKYNATPIVSLGITFNSSTATLGLNLTTLVDVNTSTEIGDHDITTSVVPTKIGKVQTLRFL